MSTTQQRIDNRPTLDADRATELTRHYARFEQFVRGRVGSDVDARDVLQQSLARAIERGGDLREGESVVAWFYRLLQNALVDHYRSRAANARGESRYATETEVTGRVQDLPVELREAVCACVRGMVNVALDPRDGEIILRADLGSEPLAAVAQDLGITANNAAVRAHRARRTLRDLIADRCGATTLDAALACECASPDCRPAGE